MNSSSWLKVVGLEGPLPRKFLSGRGIDAKKRRAAKPAVIFRDKPSSLATAPTAATATGSAAAGAETVPAAFSGALLAFAASAALTLALALPITAATAGLMAGTAAAVPAATLTRTALAAALLRGLIRAGDDGGVVKAFEPELGNLGADEALDVADVGGIFRRD
jgi:hypothetical protein